MIFARVRSQSVCILFCEPEAARPIFSPICTPSSQLWISLEQPTSRFLFPETLATNLFESFFFKKLFIRLDSSMGTWPANIFLLMEFCTRQLHFCRTPLPHHVCLSSIVPCYSFSESLLIVKQKLLKNAIWGGNVTILAKRKVFQKGENVCHFGLGFARTMVAN